MRRFPKGNLLICSGSSGFVFDGIFLKSWKGPVLGAFGASKLRNFGTSTSLLGRHFLGTVSWFIIFHLFTGLTTFLGRGEIIHLLTCMDILVASEAHHLVSSTLQIFQRSSSIALLGEAFFYPQKGSMYILYIYIYFAVFLLLQKMTCHGTINKSNRRMYVFV